MNAETPISQLSDEALDALVRAAIQPTDGLSDKIKRAVRQDAIHGMRRRNRWKRWCLASVGTAAAMLLVLHLTSPSTQGPHHDTAPQVAVAQQDGTSQQPPAATPDDSLLLDIPRPQLPSQPPKAVAMHSNRSLKLVGVGTGAVKKSLPSQQVQVVLPQQIRHVWSVEELDSACKLLGDIANANDLTLTETKKQDNSRTLTLAIKDGQLQSLVDKLHNDGWQLVSPYLPQPDQASLISYNGRTIDYTISLVRN